MAHLEIDIALPRRAYELRAELSVGDQTLALIGKSGAGKTSLLRAVAGLERPGMGRIALGDEVWFDAPSGTNVSPEHRRVGYLPQDYGLFPHMTVAGNVRFAGKRDRPDLLERLGITHLAQARPRQLSGGERQRAALARALARDPQVLLLDEPFGALDGITRVQVRDELAQWLGEISLPTLVVTHAFEDATVLARRIGVLDRGRLVQLASAHELVQQPASALVAALTGANVLEGIAAPDDDGGTLVRLSDGGELRSAARAHGAVDVAVHPWELELAAPGSAALVDRVVSVHEERGRLVIRLTRLTVHADRVNGPPAPVAGEHVGLRANPASVRLLPRAPAG